MVTRAIRINGGQRHFTVNVWNPTIANLTLMALGSSAPEILLSTIEIFSSGFYAGEFPVPTAPLHNSIAHTALYTHTVSTSCTFRRAWTKHHCRVGCLQHARHHRSVHILNTGRVGQTD